jgi:hypothetical protein
LTRRRTLSYIGACALLAACPGPRAPGPLVPMALAPASRDSATAWTRTTLPRGATLIRFRWRYEDERVKYAGRGTARIAPPDSMRFDYSGPLGLGAGAAVVVGDSVIWADPAENFRSLVPAIPMLWAALAMVQPPRDGAEVWGTVDSTENRRRVIWRFAQEDDTLDYVASTGAPAGGGVLEAEWRRRGKAMARSRTQLDAQALPRPVSARVDFPEASARFELTVGVVDTATVFPPEIWRSRR